MGEKFTGNTRFPGFSGVDVPAERFGDGEVKMRRLLDGGLVGSPVTPNADRVRAAVRGRLPG